MRAVAAVLFVCLAVLALAYLQQRKQARLELEAAREVARLNSNQVVSARAETAAVRTEMTNAIVRFQREVAVLAEEKARTETQLRAMQEEAARLKQQVEQEKNQIVEMEAERERLQTQLAAVNGQLQMAQQRLAELEQTQTGTLEQLEQLRSQIGSLQMERDSLHTRLQDLDMLREQVRLIKQRLWEQKIAERRKRDAELTAKGNRGLFPGGRWQPPAVGTVP